MNEFPVPPQREMPDAVRERIKARVFDGIDGQRRPARPRWAPAAVAAAIVAVLLAGVAFGVSHVLAPPPAPAATAPTAPPAPEVPQLSGDAVPDAALTRCVAAVRTSGHAADYPPVREWHVTKILYASSPTDVGIAVNDAFACSTNMSGVFVSRVPATQAGVIGVARVTPALLLVLNPKRAAIGFSPANVLHQGARTQQPMQPTDAVQLLTAGIAYFPTKGIRVLVGGKDAGPFPELTDEPLLVQDRQPHTVAPKPGGELSDCIGQNLPYQTPERGTWKAVLQTEPGGDTPEALVGVVGTAAGFCYATAQGTVYAGGRLPGDPEKPGIVAVRHDADGRTLVLVAAPPSLSRVEMAGVACPAANGMALCSSRSPNADQVELTADVGTGWTPLVVLPVP